MLYLYDNDYWLYICEQSRKKILSDILNFLFCRPWKYVTDAWHAIHHDLYIDCKNLKKIYKRGNMHLYIYFNFDIQITQ